MSDESDYTNEKEEENEQDFVVEFQGYLYTEEFYLEFLHLVFEMKSEVEKYNQEHLLSLSDRATDDDWIKFMFPQG